MGIEDRYICRAETRRLLVLIGVMFALVLMVQNFERPYGNILSSIFSSGKAQIKVIRTSPIGDSFQNTITPSNYTFFDGLNSTNTNKVTQISEEKDVGFENDFDEGDSPEDQSLLENFDLNHNITVENVKRDDTIVNITTSTKEIIRVYSGLSNNLSSVINSPPVKEKMGNPNVAVVSISEMNDRLVRSYTSSRTMKPRWSSPVDQELLKAKSQIENAPVIRGKPDLYAALYRNVSMFKRSYELMEKTLKIYIYKEGERPIFHNPGPVLKGIYASEGWFMKLLKANKHYVTKNPKRAHLFYLPFSSCMLERTLYIPSSQSHTNLIQYLKNYLDIIVARYPFWNRTGGSDHFLVACHDWAAYETKQVMPNSIRSLCNANIEEGFEFHKDTTLPETAVRSPQNLLRDIGGQPSSHRPILAFFTGQMHGHLRPILLQHWENKDPDMKIFKKLPKSKSNKKYTYFMKNTKYCICPKGWEVNSPRVVEAIFYECVPVIISDNFVPPFFEVLDWESFAIFVPEKDVPNLKKILVSIPEEKYVLMQQNVKQVQQHFLWHAKPVKYDIFHMILHSIWDKRVFQVGHK